MSSIITGDEGGDKRPESVKRWDYKFARRRGVCAERCPEDDHGGYRFVPVCDRSPGHTGMCSHRADEGNGMPKGHSWLPKPRARRPRPESDVRGPF